MDIGQWHIPH